LKILKFSHFKFIYQEILKKTLIDKGVRFFKWKEAIIVTIEAIKNSVERAEEMFK